jgi:hypothetical protein
MNMQDFYNAVNALAPISFLDQTGRAVFQASATDAQKQAALAYIAANLSSVTTADPVYVSKHTIEMRLDAIPSGNNDGKTKLDLALAALGSLTLKQQTLWHDAQEIDTTDADVTALLQAIGVDPTAILAP